MKAYVTQEEALQRYDITENKLAELIETDQVGTAVLSRSQADDEILIYDDDLAAYVAERDITPEKFDHLRGNLLGIGEAARKCDISQGTVSRWIQQGYLEVQRQEKNKKLVDEADVAYLVELGQAKKMRPGKKVFS